MHIRKVISTWALLALILGQATLAQHSASHIDHGFSQDIVAFYDIHDEHQHNDHQHDEDNKKHECPECLLTKSLQTAFYSAPVTLSVGLPSDILLPQQYSFVNLVNRYKANSPRAPPALLI